MTKLAILFPGQGSQEQGMGRDAAEKHAEIMDLWKLAESESGLPLREIYWDGEAGDMADTRALQPALTVVNISLWLAVRDKLAPSATAGHSLGEFASLAAAGVLSVEDTVKAVTLRGRLMAGAGQPGHGMAAVVKLDQETVEAIVENAAKSTGRELRIANYNSPAQFVISGEKEALDAAAEAVKEAKGRAIPLAVSGAFHSPLIREAADEFARLSGDPGLARVRLSRLSQRHRPARAVTGRGSGRDAAPDDLVRALDPDLAGAVRGRGPPLRGGRSQGRALQDAQAQPQGYGRRLDRGDRGVPGTGRRAVGSGPCPPSTASSATPLGHTMSPTLHNWGFEALSINAGYAPYPLEPAALSAFMDRVRAEPILGLSVTIPHKRAVMEYLDRILGEGRMGRGP